MGRLFGKFFFAILLAQCLATIGIGATFWLWDHAREAGAGPYAGPPGVDTRSKATAVGRKGTGSRILRWWWGPWPVCCWPLC